MIRVAAALLPFALAAAALAQDEDRVHVAVYKKVAPATVYVEGGRERGSGVLIDKSGYVLTSPTACGTSGQNVTVLVKGARSYPGRVVGRVNEKELVLVKVEAGRDLPFVELGDSDAARVGQVSYVLGDCYDSIRNDDQPAISMGVISGIYEVNKTQPRSIAQPQTYYTGKVLETSAAVNPNQDGGPLVDREGRLLGIVTLNYDESKFTGIAIPINELKPLIEKLRRDYENPAAAAAEKGEAWLGLEVKAVAGGLEVTRVARNGPGERAGVRRGDVVTALDAAAAASEEALRAAVGRKAPGDTVTLSLLREGERRDVPLKLARRPLY
jgi:putative serine protease PepD